MIVIPVPIHAKGVGFDVMNDDESCLAVAFDCFHVALACVDSGLMSPTAGTKVFKLEVEIQRSSRLLSKWHGVVLCFADLPTDSALHSHHKCLRF